jgi:para-aminobenzoate synthetase/4-amino-4-deoxychorismate lyase
LHASFAGDPRSLYLQLLGSQGVGYAAYLDLGDVQVASVSPERFFSIEGRRVSMRPMKGTRPRGRWPAEDVGLRDELQSSDKDRAENLMIVDLIRNDIGRIATTGSVSVDSLFAIEEYRTVWQMTSEVAATLRSDVDLVDVFSALFPCGSVTGAPKPSTMAIIAASEPARRGVYCGAIGMIPPGDGLDGSSFSVAIRTAVVDPGEGRVTYGVGGGVTWDSHAEGEYREALAKASTLAPDRPVPGLFETVRYDGGWVLLDEHLDRLEWSAVRHGITFDRAEAMGLLEAAIDGIGHAVRVRLVVERQTAMSLTVDDAPDRFAMAPGPAPDEVGLAIDDDPVDPADRTLYVKTTDRLRYEERRRRWPGADDVLLINRAGFVTESTIANVAALIDGTWYTPPVCDGLLPGILRSKLVEDGLLVERSILVADVLAADGIALVNSVRGWRPAHIERSPSAWAVELR